MKNSDTTKERAREPSLSRAYFERDLVIAACLTVLVREFYAAGLKRRSAMELLRDASDRIDAALTRGSRALVLYRLDKEKPTGIVSDDDQRLHRFERAAYADGVPLTGINPYLVAQVASEATGRPAPQFSEAAYANSTVH